MNCNQNSNYCDFLHLLMEGVCDYIICLFFEPSNIENPEKLIVNEYHINLSI
jgi:hypothetical protein